MHFCTVQQWKGQWHKGVNDAGVMGWCEYVNRMFGCQGHAWGITVSTLPFGLYYENDIIGVKGDCYIQHETGLIWKPNW